MDGAISSALMTLRPAVTCCPGSGWDQFCTTHRHQYGPKRQPRSAIDVYLAFGDNRPPLPRSYGCRHGLCGKTGQVLTMALGGIIDNSRVSGSVSFHCAHTLCFSFSSITPHLTAHFSSSQLVPVVISGVISSVLCLCDT